jgi:hypothetical protein
MEYLKTNEISQPFPSVFIIIVNWNGYNDTLECVESLYKINYKNYKVILIDNGSDTNEVDNICKRFPLSVVIRSKENLGFSGGNNLGIEYSIKSGAEYVLLLNNDTVVEVDFLNNLVENIIKNDQVGIAVPKINFYSNRNIIWYAGGAISKLRGSGFTTGFGEQDSKYFENKYVTFATGCCLLVRTDVIKKIGLMDEKYFLYLEDLDYCLRNILAGYKILFVAQSKIYHKASISTKRYNVLLPLYYVTRNRFYFISKFYKKYFYFIFIVITAIFIFKSIIWLITDRRKKIKVVKKAFKDFLDNNMGKSVEI